jgi:hypothetical protein
LKWVEELSRVILEMTLTAELIRALFKVRKELSASLSIEDENIIEGGKPIKLIDELLEHIEGDLYTVDHSVGVCGKIMDVLRV